MIYCSITGKLSFGTIDLSGFLD